MGKTSIQWTDESWNPVVGCTRVSEGCRNCYAFALHDMRHEAYKNGSKVPEQYAKPFTEIQLMPDRLTTPLKRRKPTMWFVNSVSDLFHKDVPDEFIDRVFAVMALAERHTFQVLTKRPERAAEYLRNPRVAHVVTAYNGMEFDRYRDDSRNGIEWPLRNVWIGTSVEDQKTADQRIPHLLKTEAAVRFLSCEPLLGAVDLMEWFDWQARSFSRALSRMVDGCGIHWVIVGGESGKGARPCDMAWIRSIRDQCKADGVACFIKQLGSRPEEWDEARRTPFFGPYIGNTMRDSHGGDWDEWPEDLRVREFPESASALTGG